MSASPTEPFAGMSGTMSWFSISRIISAISGLSPVHPERRLFRRTTTAALASSFDACGPTPTACECIILLLNCAMNSFVTFLSLFQPTPRLQPYIGIPLSDSSKTSFLDSFSSSTDDGLSSTCASPRATARTASSVRLLPSKTIFVCNAIPPTFPQFFKST